MRALFVAATLALAACAACSSCSSDSTDPANAVDSGGDAAAPSGGAPAGGGSGGTSIGGKDAGGTGGAAGDAAAIDAGAGWAPAPWSPPGCQILRATDLASAVPPLVWKDCGNGVTGCVYFDSSSIPGHPIKITDKISQAFDVARRTGTTLLTIIAKYGTFEGGPIVYELGYGARAAWKSDKAGTGCSAGGILFGGEQGAAISFGRSLGDEIVSYVLYSKMESWDLDGSPLLTVDKTTTGNPLAGVVRLKFSSSLMALEMGLDPFIYVWDFGPGKPVLIPRPADVAQDYGAIVKGSEVVFVRYSPDGAARTFAVRHPDGQVEKLYQKPSVWADHLASDGNDFTWQELNLATKVNELWTAPWTTSPGSFAPKKVRTVDGAQQFVLAGYRGAQWWVYRKDESILRAVRLTDGAYLDVPAPPGFGWITPLGVVDGEIWAPIFVAPGSDSTTYSVARVPIASLGTPKQ